VCFVQVDSLHTTEYLVRNGAAFEPSDNDSTFVTSSAHVVEFVRGHDVHRMVLELGPEAPRPEQFEFVIAAENGGGTVRIELSDWRVVLGKELPYQAVFVHNEERFTFRYSEVLAFRLAPHTILPTAPETAFARLGDLLKICTIHERAMAAHRNSDVDMLLGDTASESVISGRGRLSSSSLDATRERFTPYFDQTNFETYQDVVAPVIDISADGTLAWLACEIEAAGTEVDDTGESTDIAFGYSWVEMLSRHDGRWLRVGNASSARP